ncbi:MAG: metallophosphoesterase [Bacteroidota bacterium]
MKNMSMFLVLAFFSWEGYAQVLFQESFQTDLSAWEIVDDPEPRSGPGNWNIVAGELRQTSNIWSYDPPAEFIYHLGSHAVAGDSTWTDYTLNAILRSTDNDGIGLIFRYQDPQNYYRVLLMNDAGNSGSVGSAIQRIQKFENGEPRTLAQNLVQDAYPSGYFALTADVQGDSIKAYLNGNLILETEDTTYTKGQIGVLVYANSGARFDSIQVTSDLEVYQEPVIEISYPVTQDRMPYIQNPTTNSAEIAWRSVQPHTGTVEIGIEKGVYQQMVTEPGATQKHHVVLEGLEPDTRYFYRVKNGDDVLLEEESFKTAKPESETQLSFFVLGDSGVDNDIQRQVRDRMMASHNADALDFLIHVGDVHQGDGSTYDAIYFDVYEQLIRQMNFYLSIGNHDTYTDNAAPYLDDFYLPTNNPDSTERYYSFRWANSFFLSIDSNIDMRKGSPQYRFIEEQLTSTQSKSATWRFVFFHHPPYCEFWPAWDGDEVVRQDLMPLFEEHEVDIVFNGHTHAYEKGALNGVTYVISGGGGGSLDAFARDFEHITISEGVYHFSRVDIDDDELVFEAIDLDGNLVDQFTLQKAPLVSREEESAKPTGIQLLQNYPNPFNPLTSIEFRLQEAQDIEVRVFDVNGRVISTLVNQRMTAGSHTVQFDGSGLASGVYLVKLTAGGIEQHIEMTLLK